MGETDAETVFRDHRIRRSRQGRVGRIIADLLFGERSWTLRWAVVDTGDWAVGRQVLLPPSALGELDEASRRFFVDLTREQVESSPDISRDEPVSRRKETKVYSHYGWMPYYYPAVDPMSGVPANPAHIPEEGGGTLPPRGTRPPPEDFGKNPEGDVHLRSIGEVTGYYIHASDGDIGHVEQFLVDDSDWTVRYFVVDTKNWWPGKMLLVSTQWITGISWNEEHITVDLTREQVKTSPEYDPTRTVERDYETRLHDHYGYPNYWA